MSAKPHPAVSIGASAKLHHCMTQAPAVEWVVLRIVAGLITSDARPEALQIMARLLIEASENVQGFGREEHARGLTKLAEMLKDEAEIRSVSQDRSLLAN